MVEYSKVNVTLSGTQPKKLKTAAKDKTGTTLRMSLKMICLETICLIIYYWQQDKKQS